MNRYPTWKYVLIAIIIIIGITYSFPNIYGSDPALQISSSRGAEISELTELQVQIAFDEAGIKPQGYEINPNNLLIRFADEETQLRAQDAARNALDRTYVVALNLAPSTPTWLHKLGAEPMFLGLDLRGGVHFLMEVDMEAAVSKAEERSATAPRALYHERTMGSEDLLRRAEGGVLIRF